MRRDSSPTTAVETVVLLAVIAITITVVGLNAPWQGAAAGSNVSQGDDSPPPTATGEPSPLPTATAPTSPIEPPTPTSTPPPPPVRVLPNHTQYMDDEGRLHVVGEVENTTADPVYGVEVRVEFVSAAGEVVASRGAYAALHHLAAGERTCFHISLARPGPWAAYRFEEPTYEPGPQPPALSVVSDTGTYVPFSGWYLLSGQVRNDHGARVDHVFGVGTLYDAAGDVVGCDAALVLSIGLDPDQSGFFEIQFAGRDFWDVTTYRVQADGEPQ